ncbi:MAG: hypothetical protein K0R12_727 [Gammaproteobacteria bacterium]|jgi:hypothetical protein|nr:hypothetical protein [Gammaproteobacteria bacterium]
MQASNKAPIFKARRAYMKIHQVTSEYHSIEDRLLLKVNVDQEADFHFWLTRRFCQGFLQLLADIITADATLLTNYQALSSPAQFDSETTRKRVLENPENKRAILNFQRDEALSKANFSQNAFKSTGKKPFGDKPILATQLKAISQLHSLPAIEISDQKGLGLKIGLDPTLLHSLYKLLSEAAVFASWDLPVLIDAGTFAQNKPPAADNLN